MEKANCIRLIENYNQGRLTLDEVIMHLVIAASEDDAWESLSADWQSRLGDDISGAPSTNEGWSKFRIFQAGSWTSKEGFEESERRNRDLLCRYRISVERLREKLSSDLS